MLISSISAHAQKGRRFESWLRACSWVSGLIFTWVGAIELIKSINNKKTITFFSILKLQTKVKIIFSLFVLTTKKEVFKKQKGNNELLSYMPSVNDLLVLKDSNMVITRKNWQAKETKNLLKVSQVCQFQYISRTEPTISDLKNKWFIILNM